MLEFIQETVTSQLFVSMHVMLIVVHVILGGVTLCIYAERKISAYIQDRIGPNRAGLDFGLPFLFFLKGFWGLGQALADGLKMFLNEDYTPNNVDKVLFTLAPAMAIIPALLGFIIIPWGGTWDMPLFTLPLIGQIGGEEVSIVGASVNIGVIFLLAVASIGVYGVTIGGWASNNKYSFLGGLRATAQMISYEIPLGLALLAMLLIAGSFMPEGIIRHQVDHGWGLLSMPVAAVLFYVCSLAEANRTPFDNAEAEQELVGGFHTEYSSMRFGLFPLSEYAHLITGGAFFALLFMGGYHLPGIPGLSELTHPESTSILAVIVKLHVFALKVALMVFFAMLVRWTIPRLRYDQVMTMGWQSLIPIGMLLVVVTSVMVHMGWTGTWQTFLGNAVVLLVIVIAGPVLRRMFGSATASRKIQLYGSRFSPVEGELVVTAPTDPIALEDRPVQGTIQTT